MTKDDLQKIFATQIAAGITSVYYMLYDDNGMGGTKCSMQYGSLSDLDALATTLADYDYLQPSKVFVDMTSFINKACTSEIQPFVEVQSVPPVASTSSTDAQPATTESTNSTTSTDSTASTSTTGTSTTDTTPTSTSTSTTDQTTPSASTSSSSTPTSS